MSLLGVSLTVSPIVCLSLAFYVPISVMTVLLIVSHPHGPAWPGTSGCCHLGWESPVLCPQGFWVQSQTPDQATACDPQATPALPTCPGLNTGSHELCGALARGRASLELSSPPQPSRDAGHLERVGRGWGGLVTGSTRVWAPGMLSCHRPWSGSTTEPARLTPSPRATHAGGHPQASSLWSRSALEVALVLLRLLL